MSYQQEEQQLMAMVRTMRTSVQSQFCLAQPSKLGILRMGIKGIDGIRINNKARIKNCPDWLLYLNRTSESV
jgi:hypothetical protein